jgi:hypothetical protein
LSWDTAALPQDHVAERATAQLQGKRDDRARELT